VLALDPAQVSRDPAVVADYQADPLVRHRPIPAATGAEFLRHAATIMAGAATVTLPTLLLWGTADTLCPPAGAEALAGALGAGDLTTHAYPGLYHEILMEPEQDAILDTIVDWLAART
jgi:alpha-beta hydrolase superfamily lysophospholipase